jgi:hypothetical protein
MHREQAVKGHWNLEKKANVASDGLLSRCISFFGCISFGCISFRAAALDLHTISKLFLGVFFKLFDFNCRRQFSCTTV